MQPVILSSKKLWSVEPSPAEMSTAVAMAMQMEWQLTLQPSNDTFNEVTATEVACPLLPAGRGTPFRDLLGISISSGM
jgi:hypothetical protein